MFKYHTLSTFINVFNIFVYIGYFNYLLIYTYKAEIFNKVGTGFV